MGITAWDVMKAAARFDGSETAHKDTVDILKKKGHSVSMSDAWCTEQVMAILYTAGGVGSVGFHHTSDGIKREAEKKKKFHKGTSGILPFDIVLYGKGGDPNHTELAIGYDLNISGNYHGGTSRRKMSGRSIVGYVRPDYSPTPDMDNLQIAVVASQALLGVYGSTTRKAQLSVFGSKNAASILAEVDKCEDSVSHSIHILAVATIAGFMGKNAYREKLLGRYAQKVQDEINRIYALRGKSVGEAAQMVLDDKFDTNAIRRLLLGFCGYDAQKVQDRVNEMLKAPTEPPAQSESGSITFLYRGKPRKSKSIDGLQGDSWVIKMGDHALIGDTMLAGGLDKILAEVKGFKHVQMYISHPHADHMGSTANKLVKSGILEKVYLPAESTISGEYKARYKALVNDCKKKGVPVVILRQGSEFDCGHIKAKVLFQQVDAKNDSVNMRSLITLFNVAGKTYLSCGDHHTGEKESKFSYHQHVDIHILAHHALFTGSTLSFLKGISPDWIIASGWASYPNGTIAQDAKIKRAHNNSQKVGNLLVGDVNGRIELSINDGIITAKGEKNMVGKTIKYSYKGKGFQKVVHVCSKTKFFPVHSMVPSGASIIL